MQLIQRLHQIDLPALFGGRAVFVADMFDQLVDLLMLRVDVRALIDAGQEAGLPVLRFLDRVARAHGDEGGQILIVGPQAIRQPGAEAGANQPRFAAVHQQQRRLVIRHVGMHRTDDAQVVDRLGQVREDFADFDPATARLVEFVGRGKRGAGGPFGRQMHGDRLAGVFRERRLGVERVNMGCAAIEEQMNHPFRFGRQRRVLGQERIDRLGAAGHGREQPGLAEQIGQGQGAKAGAAAAQPIAARNRLGVDMGQIAHGRPPSNSAGQSHCPKFRQLTLARSVSEDAGHWSRVFSSLTLLEDVLPCGRTVARMDTVRRVSKDSTSCIVRRPR